MSQDRSHTMKVKQSNAGLNIQLIKQPIQSTSLQHGSPPRAGLSNPSKFRHIQQINQPADQPVHSSSWASQSSWCPVFTLIAFTLLLSLLFVLSLSNAMHLLHTSEISQSSDILQSTSSTIKQIPTSIHRSRQTLYRLPKLTDALFRSKRDIKTRLAMEEEAEKLMKHDAEVDEKMRHKRSTLSQEDLNTEQKAVQDLILRDANKIKQNN